METKMFEVRDRHTFIPVLGIRLNPACDADRYLLARAGYGREPEQQGTYIVLADLAGGVRSAHDDPYEWEGPGRTLREAHLYIRAHWQKLESGAVIDVQHILGETPEAKQSEAVESL